MQNYSSNNSSSVQKNDKRRDDSSLKKFNTSALLQGKLIRLPTESSRKNKQYEVHIITTFKVKKQIKVSMSFLVRERARKRGRQFLFIYSKMKEICIDLTFPRFWSC